MSLPDDTDALPSGEQPVITEAVREADSQESQSQSVDSQEEEASVTEPVSAISAVNNASGFLVRRPAVPKVAVAAAGIAQAGASVAGAELEAGDTKA